MVGGLTGKNKNIRSYQNLKKIIKKFRIYSTCKSKNKRNKYSTHLKERIFDLYDSSVINPSPKTKLVQYANRAWLAIGCGDICGLTPYCALFAYCTSFVAWNDLSIFQSLRSSHWTEEALLSTMQSVSPTEVRLKAVVKA